MSIMAVGGADLHAALAPIGAARQPESAEVPGRPDQDGDSDDIGATSEGRLSSRSVNLYA